MPAIALLWCALWMPAAAASAADVDAKKFYELGRSYFEAGQYAEALAAFETAYERKPLPGFFFNIGQCQRKLEHYDLAVEAFERYLREVPAAPNRDAVRELIVEARAARDRARGTHAATQPAVAPVAATAPAADTDATVPSLAATSAPGPASDHSDSEPAVYQTWWFWSLIGGGAAVVAGGTAAVLIALAQQPAAAEPTLGRVDLRR
jgi:tetratricopeptide (TPR) repeat protein